MCILLQFNWLYLTHPLKWLSLRTLDEQTKYRLVFTFSSLCFQLKMPTSPEIGFAFYLFFFFWGSCNINLTRVVSFHWLHFLFTNSWACANLQKYNPTLSPSLPLSIWLGVFFLGFFLLTPWKDKTKIDLSRISTQNIMFWKK